MINELEDKVIVRYYRKPVRPLLLSSRYWVFIASLTLVSAALSLGNTPSPKETALSPQTISAFLPDAYIPRSCPFEADCAVQ